MELGDKLQQLRKEKKLSQKEFGNILGSAESTISMYERNARQPDYDTLIKIARFFDVTIDYLLGESFEKRPSRDNMASREFDNLSEDEKEYLNMQLEIYRSIKK